MHIIYLLRFEISISSQQDQIILVNLYFIIKFYLTKKNKMKERTNIKLRQVKQTEELVTGDTILNEKYMLGQMIGKGSFGHVFRGVFTDKENSKRKYPHSVAIKVQNDLSKMSQIANEVTILNAIQENFKNRNCFPKLYASGIESGRLFMLMDLLGPNLYDLMSICGGKFSLQTSLLLVIQVIERIQVLHDMGYIYRDIKPQNFLMGLGGQSRSVFMVDFGLSKRYRDSCTKLLVPYRQASSLVGTIRYSSVNSHLGICQSRRDDLQSIFYMLIYFIKGELPWQGLGADQNKHQKDHLLLNYKLKMKVSDLCEGLPEQIPMLLEYIKGLGYYEEPDYDFILKELSYTLKINCGTEIVYDWQLLRQDQKLLKSNLQIIFPNDEKDSINEDLSDYSIIVDQESKKNQQNEVLQTVLI